MSVSHFAWFVARRARQNQWRIPLQTRKVCVEDRSRWRDGVPVCAVLRVHGDALTQHQRAAHKNKQM